MKNEHLLKARYQAGAAVALVAMVTGIVTPFATAGDPPLWWTNRGVISSAPQNNFGVANLGQAKWMAEQAHTELGATVPGGAGFALANLFPAKPGSPDDAWYEAQKKPLNIGQLKALARPFYDRLNGISPDWVKAQMKDNGLTTLGIHYFQDQTSGYYYPWNPATLPAENYKPANIGQLKVVFSLRFGENLDGDGAADLLELATLGSSTTDVSEAQAQQLLSSGATPDADTDQDGVANGEDAAPLDGAIWWKKTSLRNYIVLDTKVPTDTPLAKVEIRGVAPDGGILYRRGSDEHYYWHPSLSAPVLIPHETTFPVSGHSSDLLFTNLVKLNVASGGCVFGELSPLSGTLDRACRWDVQGGWVELTPGVSSWLYEARGGYVLYTYYDDTRKTELHKLGSDGAWAKKKDVIPGDTLPAPDGIVEVDGAGGYVVKAMSGGNVVYEIHRPTASGEVTMSIPASELSGEEYSHNWKYSQVKLDDAGGQEKKASILLDPISGNGTVWVESPSTGEMVKSQKTFIDAGSPMASFGEVLTVGGSLWQNGGIHNLKDRVAEDWSVITGKAMAENGVIAAEGSKDGVTASTLLLLIPVEITPKGSADTINHTNLVDCWDHDKDWFDFQGVTSKSPGEPDRNRIFIEAKVPGGLPEGLKFKWTLEASAGTLENADTEKPKHIPPAVPGEGVLKLEITDANGKLLAEAGERKLVIYKDHLERGRFNFDVEAFCGSEGWTFTRFGVTITMDEVWNCHGSMPHLYDGSNKPRYISALDANAQPALPSPLSNWPVVGSITINENEKRGYRDDGTLVGETDVDSGAGSFKVKFTAAGITLTRGDVLIYTRTGLSFIEHSHMILAADNAYGANNLTRNAEVGHNWAWAEMLAGKYHIANSNVDDDGDPLPAEDLIFPVTIEVRRPPRQN